MYHLILVATLIAGGTKEIPGKYYDNKAACMNQAVAAPDLLEDSKYWCERIKNHWFPDAARVSECLREVDPIKSVIGKCIKEN